MFILREIIFTILLFNAISCQESSSCESCLNGICVPPDSRCFCLNGFTGKNCDKELNHCSHNPCKNNSTCSNNGDDFKCQCLPGYCGKLCDEDFDDCLSNPCQNGGICTDRLNDFECVCLPGFDGHHCEIDRDSCSSISLETYHDLSVACLNNGTCVDGPGSRFWCVCPRTHTGQRCESVLNHCESNPCQNSAKCRSDIDGYHCSCLYGFTGKNCETSLKECTSEEKIICKNSGHCMETHTRKVYCFCMPDYFGKHCEKRFNDCLNESCLNNGTCLDSVDGFTCLCEKGYRGERCEIHCSEEEILEDDLRCLGRINETIVAVTPISIGQADGGNSNEKKTTKISISSINTEATPTQLTTTEKAFLVPDSLSKVLSPSFNGIDSELVFRVRRFKRSNANIRLKVKPIGQDGVILYANTSRYHLAIFMHRSNLIVHLLDQQDTEVGFKIEPDIELKSNQTYSIILSLTKNRSIMILKLQLEQNGTIVYNAQETSQEFGTIPCFEHYQFGTLRSNALGDDFPHFLGCLQNIELNNEIVYSRNAIYGHNIIECQMNHFVCASERNPCQNSGSCKQSIENEWFCDCLAGFGGWLCEKLVCTPDICMNNGLCIVNDEQHKHMCICASGYYGPYCESKLNLTYPLLNSIENQTLPSYLKYRLPIEIGEFLEIRLRMISHSLDQRLAQILEIIDVEQQQKALLKNNDIINSKSSMRLYYDRETLLLQLTDINNEMRSIRTALPVNMTEQMVLFGRFQNTFWLLVIPGDGSDLNASSSSSSSMLNGSKLGGTIKTAIQHPLQPQIGRLSNDAKFKLGPDLLIGSMGTVLGYHGCIYDIDVRSSPAKNFTRIDDRHIDSLANVEQCDFECT